ncbi:MAG: HlyD family type I secretion periplasmic adaptor subunit [Rhodobacteraceae bacterium]|nr:HlyD family type I secretion periplasmic adaptor subunit [Paracoccaceae bacterium]
MTHSTAKPDLPGVVTHTKRADKARAPRVASIIALSLSGLVIAGIALAAMTEVPEVVRAPGMIVPIGNYQQIETMEGGVVLSVHTKEGEIVTEGALLAELAHPDLSREARTMDQELSALAARIANHRALLDTVIPGRTLDIGEISQLEQNGLSHAAVQSRIYRASQKIQTTTIDQMTRTVQILEQAMRFATARADSKEDDLVLAEDLHKRGLTPLRELQSKRHGANDMRAAATDATVRLAEAEQTLRLAIAAQQEEALTLRAEQFSQLLDLEREFDTITAARAALAERLDALRITATTAGVIQSVAYPKPGEVIARGETLFEILPIDQALVAEVRIPTIDIGHVSPGDAVTLSVDTFDARRFGKVEGEIITISPASVTDESTGEDFYRATIGLGEAEIGKGNLKRKLRSGMTVVAETVTDKRNALAYLLKPVQRSMEGALGER